MPHLLKFFGVVFLKGFEALLDGFPHFVHSLFIRFGQFAQLFGKTTFPLDCTIRVKRKTRKSETLAIGRDFVEHLREFMEWKIRVGQPTGTTGALFVGQRGPLSRQGLQQIWKRAIRLAALSPELSIQSSRHTVAVHLLQKTRNLRQVQKQIGHASPSTTANLYADISFEDMRDGVEDLYDDTG
jgi:site-specific recombinase XerD